MSERAFVGRPFAGWVAGHSLPQVGRLLEEPHSGRVFAIDVIAQSIMPLDGGTHRQVEGPRGTYVLDGLWHPDLGLLLAFGRTRGRGPWATVRVCDDGSVQDVGVAQDVAVMSMCLTDSGDVLLGVASEESSGGRQTGGGIASFSPRTKTLSWLYKPPSGEQFVPSGICWDGRTALFVHTRSHVLMRVTARGEVECVVGQMGSPGPDMRCLNNPTGVSASDGRVLVTDRGNHRVLLVDGDGRLLGHFGDHEEGSRLTDPRHALLAAGRVYIADRGARAVIELSADLHSTRRRWGGPEARGLMLSRPRSIERATSGELVVADTNNDRIVGVDDEGRTLWQIRQVRAPGGGVQDLNWPRCARMSRAGRLVVADGLNSRFLVIDHEGLIETEFSRVAAADESYAASDPHDARWIGEDELLVVDSAAGWVARVRCDGSAAWVVADLVDPHQADLYRDWVVIVDPELDAVLLIDAESGIELWRRSEFFDAAGHRYRLLKPRAVRAAIGQVLIVDADCQVLALGEDWVVQWAWDGAAYQRQGHQADFEVPEAPRDIVVDSADRFLLSDYRNSCVVELNAVSEPHAQAPLSPTQGESAKYASRDRVPADDRSRRQPEERPGS